MIIDTKKEAYENCTHFDSCSVNRCPLHPNWNTLKSHSLDKEKVCKCPRTHIRRLSKAFRESFTHGNRNKNIKDGNMINNHRKKEIVRKERVKWERKHKRELKQLDDGKNINLSLFLV